MSFQFTDCGMDDESYFVAVTSLMSSVNYLYESNGVQSHPLPLVAGSRIVLACLI